MSWKEQKKLFILVLVLHALFSSVISFGQSNQDLAQQNHTQREKLKALIQQERKTLLMANNRGAELEHRLFELGSEELRILRQEENELFINQGAKESERAHYFKASSQIERELYEKGMAHIEQFAQYKRKGEVYYTLALNNLEFSDARLAEALFHRALENTVTDSIPNYLVRVSLAEFYFNEKKYLPAIAQYQVVIQNYTDKWRPKHLYNMAWSYLKAMDYASALDKLKEALVQSKKKSMVDNSAQILESVPMFFVLERKVPECIETIKKYAPKPIPLLLKLATTAGEKMGEPAALLALKQARSLASISVEREDNFQVLDWELDFHQVQKRSVDFLKGLQTFVAFHKKQALPKDTLETVVNKTKFFVGDLQETLAKDVREDASVYNKEKLQVILDTFEALAVLAPKEEGDWRFYQAESLFAIRNFEQAFRAYAMGMKAAMEKRVAPEIAPKIFASAFSTLEEKSFPQAQKESSLRLSYESYLNIWPKSEQAASIYQKLGSLYLHQKSTADVERVLDKYHGSYPADNEIQKTQLLSLMDIYIEKKETLTISRWLEKMKQGEFQVNSEKVKEIEVVLGQILFGQYEKMADRDQAIKGLKQLYASEVYPDSIKEKSSYNLAVEYVKRGESSDVLAWALKSLPLTPQEALQVKTGSFLAMLLAFNDWGEWKRSIELAQALEKRAAEFKEQKERDSLFKLYALAMIQKRDFEKYGELLSFAQTHSVDDKITTTLITQLANSWALKEDDWAEEKNLVSALSSETVQALAERSLIEEWVEDQSINKKLLPLASSEIQKGLEQLQSTQQAINKIPLEFVYEGEAFEVEKFKLSLAALMEGLKARVAESESLAQAKNPLFLIAGQELLLKTYQQFTTSLNAKVFIFPSEELKVALDKEKQNMALEIGKRSQDLLNSRKELLARTDLAILLDKKPKVKMEMGRCQLKGELKAQTYQNNKIEFFKKQSICFALDGKWEAAMSALARLEEVGGGPDQSELKLVQGLGHMALGEATQSLKELSDWKRSAQSKQDQDLDSDQLEIVNSLLRSYGKEQSEQPRSLSWNQ